MRGIKAGGRGEGWGEGGWVVAKFLFQNQAQVTSIKTCIPPDS